LDLLPRPGAFFDPVEIGHDHAAYDVLGFSGAGDGGIDSFTQRKFTKQL
jgi:hypothetical protein